MSPADDIREEIRAASDIVDIVGGYVQLKRRGRQYVGLCPFHNEKTPSFYVSPDRGRFKCFGCDKGGDVFGFVMEMESQTFPEAMRSLAERAHIEIPDRSRSRERAKENERNSAALRVAAAFYQAHLHKMPEGHAVLQDLQSRKLTIATAREFGLGYAPEDGRGLVDAAAKEQIALSALSDAELAGQQKGAEEFCDRLCGHLVFPIHSKTGRIIGFAARALTEAPEGPAYALAFNTRLQSPRRALYGLYQAKAAIREAEEVFLVDRIADVLAMHQEGIKNTVACVGVSLTSEQVQLLNQFAKRLVVIHDAQPAAMNAATRMINTALAGGMRVYDVTLPKGMGPAQVIETDGSATLKTCLFEDRTDFVTFLRQNYHNQREQLAPEREDEVHRAVATALANIGDTILLGKYVDHAASVLAVDKKAIRDAVAKAQEVHELQAGLEFFQDQLKHATDGERERRQLAQEYGIHAAAIEAFGLGYAPDQWDALMKAAKARGLDMEALHDAGLLRVKEREEGPWYFDRFRGRVIFPVSSALGDVVGLRGIGLGNADTDKHAKWPEETDYARDDNLYGLYQGKGAARERAEVLLVDDFWDVLVLHAAGIANVVSPVGESLTPGMAEQIGQFVPRIVFVYRAGAAHPTAMLRDINRALSVGLGADVVELPGQDCRAFISERGGDAFQAFLKERRRDLVRVVYDDRHDRGLLTDASGLDQVHRDIATMIKRIADPAVNKQYEARAGMVDREERIYDALGYASYHFQRQLRASKEGSEGARYLARRGLNRATIEGFRLGFAPDRWDVLLKAATRNGISLEILEEAGLVKPSEDGKRPYDRFRGRVIFPIHSSGGDVIGFGGRILKETEHAPKYLNTPETPVYKKSSALYGLYQSIGTAKARGEVILVEGYTDVLALHQAGITNAVACCGTALTGGQISVLQRYADRLLLLYDADEAGSKAALRAIDLALEGGMTPFAAALPAGEDPDSYINSSGASVFRNYLGQHRMGFVEFLYGHFERRGEMNTPEGKADASHAVISSIGKIGDPERRESALRQASTVFSVSLDAMRAALGDKVPPAVRHDSRKEHRVPAAQAPRDEARRIRDHRRRAPRGTFLHPSEKALLEIMVKGGEYMIRFIMERVNDGAFTEGLARRLASLLVEKYQSDAAARGKEHGDPELEHLISVLKEDKQQVSPGWALRSMGHVQYNRDLEKAARGAIKQLKLHRIGELKASVDRKIEAAAPVVPEQLLREVQRLNEAKRDVEASR